MFQRALCPLPLANALANITRQGTVVEHVQVGIEEFPLLRAEVLCHLRVDAFDVIPGVPDCSIKERKFGFDVFRIAIRHQLQPRRRKHHVGGADADARNTRNAMKTGLAFFCTVCAGEQVVHIAGGFCMRNKPRHLGRKGDQEGYLFFEVTTRLPILNHEHAEYLPDVDDGHAEERLERLLAHAQYLVVALVLGGILQVDGLGAFRDQPHDAFGRSQGHASHQFRVEPFVGDEHETPRVPVAEIDRADLRIEDHRHPGDEQVQRRTEPRRGANVLDDLSQRVEHR